MCEPTIGCVIQLDPTVHGDADGFWEGQLLLVTDVRSWGVEAYAKLRGGRAYKRVETGTFEIIGEAPWLPKDVAESTPRWSSRVSEVDDG